jgi:DNA-binding NarL/FixJ family response regulator
MNRARLLLADDHRMVAQGLTSILAADFELVGMVQDGRAMIEAARTLRPDVIVADISMPLLNGIEALESLSREGIRIPVVFLTMHRHPGYAKRALEAGAAGYVLKHAAPAELVQAVRAALEGGTFLSPALTDAVLACVRKGVADPVTRLTSHQRDILRMLADGLSAKQIAKELGISPRTVESHKYQIMDALGASSTAELIRFAIRYGVVEP